jgi:hypothetical protein
VCVCVCVCVFCEGELPSRHLGLLESGDLCPSQSSQSLHSLFYLPFPSKDLVKRNEMSLLHCYFPSLYEGLLGTEQARTWFIVQHQHF